MAKTDFIRVAIDVGKGIMVHAKGNPAKVVAVGAAAAVAVIGTAVGYGVYAGGKFLADKINGNKRLKE